MAVGYVADVRNAEAVLERKDLEGWIDLFTPAGEFTDNSVGVTYRNLAVMDLVPFEQAALKQ